MYKEYDALDWQSFSQKKNIEEIAKNTKDKTDIQLTAAIEMTLTVSSIVAEKLFDDNISPLFWWIILIIALIPIIWLIYKYTKRFINRNKPGSDIPDLNSMINLFDNDICYYVLMAKSYTDKILNSGTNISLDIKQFYFIEACFYINKAIYNLSLTSPCMDNLYSSNSKDLFENRKISYTRLKNIFNILDDCMNKVSSFNSIISNIDSNSNYIKLCESYIGEYSRFKDLFKDIS